jgi:hypothetical protein
MADRAAEVETKLASLRARRQRWHLRFEAVEHVHGEAVERANCKQSLGRVDRLIAEAEAELQGARVKCRGGIADVEEVVDPKARLDELRALAVSCDTHARELGIAAKELHHKLSGARVINGRGPSGLMLSINLRQAFEQYVSGTPLCARPFPASRHKTFAQLIDAWSVMLSPAAPKPPPPPPAPAAPRDRGFARQEGKPSVRGGPTIGGYNG